MTSPALPMPLRIAVKGASTVSWTSFMSGPRHEFTFPRVIESELLSWGQPVQMSVISVPAELVRDQLDRYERELGGWSPDVIVLSYGHAESVHFLLPLWLQRHAHGMQSRPGPVRDVYRKRLLEPAWRFLAKVQRPLDARLPSVRRRRLRRMGADLERLTRRLATFASPLILVCDVPAPAPMWDGWFPGMRARTLQATREVEGVVERIDLPNVQLFSIEKIVREYREGGEEPCTDGAHFIPEVHDQIGRGLAAQIRVWADTQPHLYLRSANEHHPDHS